MLRASLGIRVGNASDALLEAGPDSDGLLAGGIADGIEYKREKRIPGDASTVRTATKRPVLDGEELRRQDRGGDHGETVSPF